ncbi:hypothetical protein [Sphingomonas segetis]|jgi:hypothetical protein|uniref:hypothetical protein n=1 Tax=Sphingomonas segetis TaxID=1104779 RepID=UPI0012D2E24B|nr:hypothetical protein [Sphingomonas segetis]
MTHDEIMQEQTHMTDHKIPLTATIVGNKVRISGNGDADLKPNSGGHRFEFAIASPPGLTVEFASLDSEDNCSTCPPASGENSKQIVSVKIYPTTASFNDNNNNSVPMDVSYQWNFTCDNPKLTVEPFDPIIKNGGTTTPVSGIA